MKNIICCHGMWGTGAFWKPLKDKIENEDNIKGHYLDLPNHISDNQDVGNKSITFYYQHVREKIKEITDGQNKPIGIGHSMGGLIMQKMAEENLLDAVIALTPAAPSGINALKWSVIKSFSSILIKPNFWKKKHKLNFEKAVYAMLNKVDKKTQKKIYENLVYESGKAAFEIGFSFLDFNKSTKINESQVKCPMLVIAGAEDRITPASTVRKVAKKYNADYIEYKNHGHYLLYERGWEYIYNDIISWMKKKNLI